MSKKKKGNKKTNKNTEAAVTASRKPTVVFRSGWTAKGSSMLRLIDGTMDEVTCIAIGLRWYEPKKNEGSENGYWYYKNHPSNRDALSRLRRTVHVLGYEAQIEIVAGNGKRADDILLPARVPHLQGRYVDFHGGDTTQCGEDVYNAVDKLVADKHPHLASAGLLICFEDFDPKKKAQQMGLTGSVQGYAKKLGKATVDATGYIFQICLCAEIWATLNVRHRNFLLNHELTHCAMTEAGVWSLKDHDLQMFTSDLVGFPDIVASQLESAKASLELGLAKKAEHDKNMIARQKAAAKKGEAIRARRAGAKKKKATPTKKTPAAPVTPRKRRPKTNPKKKAP